MTGVLPPASEEAERALIGSVLVDPKAFIQLTALVGSEDFLAPQNGEIWEAILALQRKRRAIDLVSVEDEIRTRALKKLEPGYLLKCANETPVIQNAEHYARLVREKATLRRLITTCAEIQSCAHGDFDSAPEFLRDAVVKVSKVAMSDAAVQTEAISDTTERVIATMEASEKGQIVSRIPTGIDRLDALLDGGIRLGYLVVPVAMTSIGKSSWARQVAFRGARDRSIPALIFSLEDSREDTLVAGAANLARIDNRMFAPKTPTTIPPDNQARWRTMNGALSVAASLGALIQIETHRHIGQIVAVTAAWRARQKRAGVVVVDQISWVRGVRGKGETREQEVAGVSRTLRDLAKELGVVVIAPSQLTDEARREGKLPGFGQTRESRAVEQDADILLALHRKRQRMHEPCQLAVLKHRGGATGYCQVMWRGPWNGFEPPTNEDEREMEESNG